MDSETHNRQEKITENSSNSVASEAVIHEQAVETNSVGNDRDSKTKADVLEEQSSVPPEEVQGSIPELEKEASVVINVKCSAGENCDAEKVCRICHLSFERQSEGSDMIQLGCACKDELGIAHRHCAESWFKLKGNRCCEICGAPAKNITGVGDRRFIEVRSERRTMGSSSSSNRYTYNYNYSSSYSERGRCCRGQPFCSFLMGCLIIAFILPWFFRVNMF